MRKYLGILIKLRFEIQVGVCKRSNIKVLMRCVYVCVCVFVYI